MITNSLNKRNARIFFKGFIWEILGVLILYIISGNFRISMVYFTTRIILYYWYHILWKKINWLK